MDIDRFKALMAEGATGASVTAPNDRDLKMRVAAVPDAIGLSLRCVRLGIREVEIEAEADEIIVTFRDAQKLGFQALDRLTDRERQVMELLASGKTNGEIAMDLDISVKTVDTHRHHTLKKLGLRNNAELTRFAIRTGLVMV